MTFVVDNQTLGDRAEYQFVDESVDFEPHAADTDFSVRLPLPPQPASVVWKRKAAPHLKWHYRHCRFVGWGGGVRHRDPLPLCTTIPRNTGLRRGRFECHRRDGNYRAPFPLATVRRVGQVGSSVPLSELCVSYCPAIF